MNKDKVEEVAWHCFMAGKYNYSDSDFKTFFEKIYRAVKEE